MNLDKLLEPEVVLLSRLANVSVTDLAALSTAASLKRIADMLEGTHSQYTVLESIRDSLKD